MEVENGQFKEQVSLIWCIWIKAISQSGKMVKLNSIWNLDEGMEGARETYTVWRELEPHKDSKLHMIIERNTGEQQQTHVQIVSKVGLKTLNWCQTNSTKRRHVAYGKCKVK